MQSRAVNAAVTKLNHILPLRDNQLSLPAGIAQIHQAILKSYVDLGRSLTRAEIEDRDDNAAEVIELLANKDMIVLGDNGELTGAYPFTMENRVHTVEVNRHVLHCMCALDALAVGPMFDMPATVKSVCHVTSEPVDVAMSGDEVMNKSDVEDLYFGICWSAADNVCCASSLCTEMIFLKGKKIAEEWCSKNADNRECFTLDEAIDFAARFFRPLLQALPD